MTSSCKERSPLAYLPCEQAWNAEDDVGNTLDEGHRNCDVRRYAENRANSDKTAFLRPERSRNGEGRAANRLREAFDDERLGDSSAGKPMKNSIVHTSRAPKSQTVRWIVAAAESPARFA